MIWRRGDDSYPQSLEDLDCPPPQLFALGDRSMLEPPTVSIVGTRDATGYGLRITRAIAGALARAGVSIVSGMARGIDAAAHRAALEAGGRTVAVMGTGVDVPYPVAHRELHRLISEKGLVISENGMGARAHKGAFPKRNRIIAALAKVTIVIEGAETSGALNTADWAGDLRRTVAAVPGPIDSPQSAGTNLLIRTKSATMLSAVDEALALVGVDAPRRAPEPQLDETERAIWNALGDGGLDVDALCTRSNLPARECLAAITSLELHGMVECLLTGEVRRR
ncbi:MAG: DNA-processing protein DprA [Gemmatimonadaceae bacterium]